MVVVELPCRSRMRGMGWTGARAPAPAMDYCHFMLPACLDVLFIILFVGFINNKQGRRILKENKNFNNNILAGVWMIFSE